MEGKGGTVTLRLCESRYVTVCHDVSQRDWVDVHKLKYTCLCHTKHPHGHSSEI